MLIQCHRHSLALACAVALLCFPQWATSATQTVMVGSHPYAIAVNSVTNKIYVANYSASSVTIIDGASTGTVTIPTGAYPAALAVNDVTNKIYVANQGSNTVTVIDGATNTPSTVSVGTYPISVAVNRSTNQIYVANFHSSNVTVIDGVSRSATTLGVGSYPSSVAVNEVTNQIYVANAGTDTVSVIDGSARTVTATVPTGTSPESLAINATTNQIYVANFAKSGSVTVIDGASNSTTNISTAAYPVAVVVNPDTNTVYAASNVASGVLTTIDATSGSTTMLTVGSYPQALALNLVTNTVYVANHNSNNVTILNRTTGASFAPSVGKSPTALAVNPITNRLYVANYADNSVTLIDGLAYTPLRYVPVSPCRVVDTRWSAGPFGGPAIAGQSSRDFALPNGSCGIPPTAVAYSLNVAVVPHGSLGYLSVWPTGTNQPKVATLNSLDGRIKSNAAIVPAGAGGGLSVFASMDTQATTDVVLDVNGYFESATYPGTLAFYPVSPCRIADTRTAKGSFGGPFLGAGQTRDFPILQSACNLPSTALAYSLNFAVIPRAPLGYLTAWPHGESQPTVATLNALTGTVTANAALVRAGENGIIDVFATSDTDLVIDLNGYFALAGTGQNPQSLYTMTPCRVLDTRLAAGRFSGDLTPPVNVAASGCAIPTTAQAVIFNATVVPSGALGYLTLWPDGQPQPQVASLNALDGMITNNMAIVPMTNGIVDAFASGTTNLVLDAFGYFAQ
jgi:YVTN family beta-propeller protein